VDALDLLKRDDVLRRGKGERARRRAEELSWTRAAKATGQLYAKLLS
jgi:glycosyltransferase involved in cell wall biosynthesis